MTETDIEPRNNRRPFRKVNWPYKWVAGILGGIAYSFGLPVLVVRIVFILLLLCTNPYLDYVGGIAFWSYILIWIFAPRWGEDPDDYETRTA